MFGLPCKCWYTRLLTWVCVCQQPSSQTMASCLPTSIRRHLMCTGRPRCSTPRCCRELLSRETALLLLRPVSSTVTLMQMLLYKAADLGMRLSAAFRVTDGHPLLGRQPADAQCAPAALDAVLLPVGGLHAGHGVHLPGARCRCDKLRENS